jgi:hypothetical protein
MSYKLEELDLSSNPLHRIKHDAFRECRQIQTLNLRRVHFKNRRGDLKFLKRLYELEELDLSYAFINEDYTDLTRIYEVFTL